MDGDFEIKSLFALENNCKFIEQTFIHMKMMKYIYCLDHIHVANRNFHSSNLFLWCEISYKYGHDKTCDKGKVGK